MSSPNGNSSPNSGVGNVHSPRPVGAITPHAPISGKKLPATVGKKPAKSGGKGGSKKGK